MGLLLRLLVFGMFCALCSGYAGVCKQPKTIDNFNMRRFSGSWYYSAMDISSQRDQISYGSARCGVVFFHIDKGKFRTNKAESDLTFGNTVISLPGTYYLPDPNKSFIKMRYISINVTYDYTVLCTDYSTYQVSYACNEVTPNYTSEFVFIFVRDPNAYKEVVSKEEVVSCLKRLTNKTARQIPIHSQKNCLPET